MGIIIFNMRTEVFAALVASTATAYDQSMAHCQTFAAKFHNTCGGVTAANAFVGAMSGWNGTTITCGINPNKNAGDESTMKCIDGNQNATTCSWSYKMCVYCSDVNGVTTINVQTNSLPDHCYASGGPPNYPVEAEIAWSSAWNPNVQGVLNYAETQVDTAQKVESLLCNLMVTSD